MSTEHEAELVRLRAENERLRAESESRFDCHAGPGTTEPACGGCVTCLLRDLEAAEAERDTLRDRLSRAEKLLRSLAERAESVGSYVEATVSRNNTFEHSFKGRGDPNDWRLAHGGRLASSERQLGALIKEAREARTALSESTPPDEKETTQ